MDATIMSKPFKFRYVNEIVGVFVLLVLTLVIAGIVVAGRAQGWFEPVHEVRVEFPDEEGSMGLRRGSEVRVLDTPAGMVMDIQPREDGVMEGIFRVRGQFFQYVRQDSTGVVMRAFAVAGDAYVEITRGRGDPLPEEHPYIPIIRDTELLDLAESLLDEVRATTVPAIEQLQRLLEEATALTTDLRDPEGDVQQMLASVNRMIQGVEAGEGAVGKLLRDPEVADEVAGLVTQVGTLLEEVQLILEDVGRATVQLPQMTDRLAGELEDVPGLVYQTQATLQEAEVLLTGIQRHWLLRRYVEHEDRLEADRLQPTWIIGAGGDTL